MSASNAPVPAHRHGHSPSIPSSRVNQHQQYPSRYNNNQLNPNKNNNYPSTSTMNYRQQPTTPPRTPRRRMAGPGPDRNATVESATESGPETQARPPRSTRQFNKTTKTPAITPAALRADRGTPPVQRVQSSGSVKPKGTSTTTAITAYAGPTFHASPAPSALPIPSFYLKPAESPSVTALGIVDSDPSDSSSATDSPSFSIVKPARELNVNDAILTAESLEKERVRSAQSDSGPFGPPPEDPRTGRVTPGQRPPYKTTNSASNLFAMEMEGFQGKPIGPSFSTPYNDRLNAARSTPSGSAYNSPGATVGSSTVTDSSQALKDFLFNGKSTPVSNPRPAEVPYSDGPLQSPYQNRPLQPTYQNVPSQPMYQNGPHNSSPAPNHFYGSPQQPRFANYPGVNGYGGNGNQFNNSPRSSGLRQEVHVMNNAMVNNNLPCNGPFGNQQPLLNVKENSMSGAPGHISNFGFNSAPHGVTQYRPHDDSIEKMENTLRSVLKLGPEPNGVMNSGVVPGRI